MGKFLQTAQAAVNRTWGTFGSLETKASKAGKLISMQFVGQPMWTPRQYDQLADEAYVKNAVAYRAIAEVSKCGGSVPFVLSKGKGRNKKEIDDHKLLDLLRRPNPMQSRSTWMQTLVGFYLISGNTYQERVGPTMGPPKELWSKRPDRMMVVAGSRGTPKSYMFKMTDGSVEWPVDARTGLSKILHIKAFHPTNDWYGMSPLEAAAFAVDQHNEAGKWNMSLLQNSGRPSGALIIDPKSGIGLDDDQYNRLKADIEEKYTGTMYAGRPLLLEGGLDWKEMSLSPTDMDWLEGKHTSARDIAMVIGMPAQMLGIPGDNTHRNMEEARLWLWEQTIMPLLDMILEELNWWLTPLFGEDLSLGFDYDEVPALISRRYTLWDKVTKADFITINEKRKATGYEPRDEGDVIRNPGKNVNLGDEPEPEPVVEPVADPEAIPKPNPKPKLVPKPNGSKPNGVNNAKA